MTITHFDDWNDSIAARVAADRQSLARRETENYLRDVTESTFGARTERWERDYGSLDAYQASLSPMRRRWTDALGVFDLQGDGDAASYHDFFETDRVEARWITLPVTETFAARAVLALPKDQAPPYPLVIAQHGIGSSPERVFGLDDERDLYHRYGHHLIEAGYAVLAPQHISQAEPRARYQRMCLMLGKTLWGLEIGKLRAWIDYVQTLPMIDADAIAMWGISLGGAYTLFTAALEERIRVAICTAWFNDRLPKMILDDPRYSCFLSTAEEHIFIPSWLRDFGDSDLVSLICPRPFMAQTGKGDSIAWWPDVVAEFEVARGHYHELGLEERITLDLHEGGHEIGVTTGISFLDRWLRAPEAQSMQQQRPETATGQGDGP